MKKLNVKIWLAVIVVIAVMLVECSCDQERETNRVKGSFEELSGVSYILPLEDLQSIDLSPDSEYAIGAANAKRIVSELRSSEDVDIYFSVGGGYCLFVMNDVAVPFEVYYDEDIEAVLVRGKDGKVRLSKELYRVMREMAPPDVKSFPSMEVPESGFRPPGDAR